MKRPASALLFVLLAAEPTSASPDDYVNFMRQVEYDTLLQWDVPIDLAGTMLSPMEMGSVGSLYEVWSVHSPTADQALVAAEFVSDYSPSIDVVIETGDPYPYGARTRIDQPFTVRVTVTDISTNPTAPPAATMVHFAHDTYVLPEGSYALDDIGAETPQSSEEFAIDNEGELVLEFASPSLTGTDLSLTQGIETFSVSSFFENNGHGNNNDGTDSSNTGKKPGTDSSGSFDDELFGGGRYLVGAIMEEAILQVWPIASATISGIDPTVAYEDIPAFAVNLGNLYPDSTTYLRVYEGSPTATPAEPITIGAAAAIIRDSVPQNRTMVIQDLDKFLPHSGSYTLEVMHETPFGTDILAQFHPLVVEWQVGVRGSFYAGTGN